MKIVGINKGMTDYGRRLTDGSLTYMEDGRIVALIMEERLTNSLRKGGYEEAEKELKRVYGINLGEVDHIGISTCMEPAASSLTGMEKLSRCEAVSHHFSHAFGAWEMSDFDNALVVVMDGGGNILSDYNNERWWEEPREQISYYYFENGNGRLLGRDFDAAWEMGFGEMYRSACYLLGFGTSRKAANVMALAGYGDYRRFCTIPFWRIEDGKLCSDFRYNFQHPEAVFEPIWKLSGKRLISLKGEIKDYNDEVAGSYADFCAYLQWNIGSALLAKLSFLKKEVHTENLCLTGGVALNCVLNAKIAQSGLFSSVYVPCCPGDHGQSVGNALYLNHKYYGKGAVKFLLSQDTYLGSADLSQCGFKEIATSLNKDSENGEEYIIIPTTEVADDVSQLLLHKHVVAAAFGRSEFGYRGLGNRSIIADVSDDISLDKIKLMKSRNWYRPFAPVILKSKYQKLFPEGVDSPFMSFAVDTAPYAIFGGCQSVDKKARVQTVDEGCMLGKILTKLGEKGKAPVCLNTSLNLKGYPIADSLENVIKTYKSIQCNFLALDKNIVVKKLDYENMKIFDIDPECRCTVAVRKGNEVIECRDEIQDSVSVIDWVMEHTGCKTVYLRKNFGLNQEYMRWLREGKKHSTLRFKHCSVEYPQHFSRGMWKTQEFEILNESNLKEPDLYINIQRIEYCRFCDLTQEDARRDGFQSLDEMKEAFKNLMYPDISDKEWMTIYFLHLQENDQRKGRS